jgi:hypothetical protein
MTPKKPMTPEQIEAIETHLRTADMTVLEPLYGSTLAEKMGNCEQCHTRLDARLLCPTHGPETMPPTEDGSQPPPPIVGSIVRLRKPP